jgi:hypothetical protein
MISRRLETVSFQYCGGKREIIIERRTYMHAELRPSSKVGNCCNLRGGILGNDSDPHPAVTAAITSGAFGFST